MLDAKKIADEYLNWVKGNYNFLQLEYSGSIDIQTPFIDSFGDNISFIVKLVDDKLVLSDEGFTIWNLENNGTIVTRKNTHKRRILNSVIRLDNAQLTEDNEIIKTVYKKNIGQAVHDMTQLIFKINDMTMLSSSNIKSIFYDEALEYFNKHPSMYHKIPSFSIIGKSQLSHKIDFGFFTKEGIKLVKVHNSLTRSTVERAIVTLVDTADYRKINYQENEKLCLLVNGVDKSKDNTINNIDSLAEYNIDIVDFTDKKEVEKKLAISI
jgi:hypothetical protein